MFAGKSLELLRRVDIARMLYGAEHVLVFNHASDTRYGQNAVRTHTDRAMPCQMLRTFGEIPNAAEYADSRCIFVEEAHLWDGDLCEFLHRAVDSEGKHVTVCGLNGGYQRTCVGRLHEAIPLADEIVHLKALCLRCRPNKCDALFTHRKVPLEDGHSLVGGAAEYESLCRRHYLRPESDLKFSAL